MRIDKHPVLGDREVGRVVSIFVDGKEYHAVEGEPIAAALLANGLKVMRKTPRYGEPRGIFCGIGRCTDCIMTVEGTPNVRTCITPVAAGMKITSNIDGGEDHND